MDSILRNPLTIAAFVLPAMALYTLVLFVPMVWSIGYTFFSGSPITGFTFSGFDNYQQLFADGAFWQAFLFGTRYALIVSTLQIVLGLALALIYHFYLKRSSTLIRTVVFIPMILPTVAVSQIFIKLFEIAPQYGLVNSFLALFGFEDAVRPFLGQADSAFWVIVTMDVWKEIGFFAILLYAGLVDLPQDIIEAARLDGAKGLRMLRRIILPILGPVVITSLIFSLNSSLKVFDSIMALTNGGPGTSTSPLTIYMHRVSFGYGEYGYGSTVAVALTVQCLIFTLIVLAWSRRSSNR